MLSSLILSNFSISSPGTSFEVAIFLSRESSTFIKSSFNLLSLGCSDLISSFKISNNLPLSSPASKILSSDTSFLRNISLISDVDLVSMSLSESNNPKRDFLGWSDCNAASIESTEILFLLHKSTNCFSDFLSKSCFFMISLNFPSGSFSFTNSLIFPTGTPFS